MANSPVSTAPFALEQFTALLASCQWPLYTFLRGMVGDDEHARDLMQDTFYDAWRTAQRGMPPFHTGSASEVGIRRWLFHVAYNRACSALRRRRLISWLPLDSFSSTAGEGASFENQVAESQAVRAAMASLAPADASCLFLIAVHGFTAAEVSEIIGGSPQAVAKRFSRAKQRLRTLYLAQNEAALLRTFAPPPGALPPFSREEIMHILSDPAKRAAPSATLVAHVERPQQRRQRGNLLAFAAALVLVLLAVGIFSFPGLLPRQVGKGAPTPVSKKQPSVDLSHFLLNSIAMVSPDEGWAVGTTLLPQTPASHSKLEDIYGDPVILHYSQGHWRPVPLPLHCQAGCHMVLHSIAMVSAAEGWAVGNSVLPPGADGITSGFILHYTGGKWSVYGQRGSELSRVVMSSASDGWIIGSGIYHYQGATWSQVNDPAFAPIIPQTIIAPSATNVWLVGAGPALPGSTGFDGDASEIILHYDGRRWTQVKSDLANSPISALAMVSPTEGWAVGCLSGGLGEHPAHPEKALVEQYTQGRWQLAASFASSSGAYYCSHGITLVSADEGWAVGSDGLIVHGLHGVWTRIAGPTGQALNSIVMLSPTEGWAVGDQGTILHYVHGSWSRYQG